MTKAKAIEILNQRYDEYVFIQRLRFSNESDVINRMIALLTAIDALEQDSSVKAEPDNGWISVKDRRPEPNTWIMVYIKYPSPVFEFETGIQKMSGIKKVFYYGEGFYCEFGTITHWRPLLEPPESEDTE